jgi:glycosyltransferase involved in cell wall biosynthesis
MISEIKPQSGEKGAHPFFSVIIPTYNRAHLLPRAIKSVIAQTFTSFELIIVDDGSTDQTENVVRQFADNRIRYITQENKGRCAARNAGIAVAVADYITFLDSDDEADPEWLNSMAEACSDSNCGIVCCGRTAIVNREHLGKRQFVQLPRLLNEMYENQPGLFLPGTFVVRASVLHAAGGYIDGISYGENSELALRLIPTCLSQGKQVLTIHKPLVFFHTTRPFGGSKDFQERLESAELILQLHGEKYRSRNPRAYANHCGIAGVNAARLGLNGKARKLFWLSIRSDPFRLKHYVRLLLSMVPMLGKNFWMRYNNDSHPIDAV